MLDASAYCPIKMVSLPESGLSEAQIFPDKVSLRGASELTSSFLKCAINSILYNRQMFPKQSFAPAQRFGCEVRVTKDEWLEKYLTKFFGQFETWLVSGLVLSLDMTLSSVGSGPGEFLEIWRFGIQSHPPDGKSSMYSINSDALSSDMSDLLRSIEHSCSFLVGIPPNCKFDIDVYCDSSATASESWTHTTGNLLAVEKSSIRTIKLDQSVDIAAHHVVCSLVMNSLEHMVVGASSAARDQQ